MLTSRRPVKGVQLGHNLQAKEIGMEVGGMEQNSGLLKARTPAGEEGRICPTSWPCSLACGRNKAWLLDGGCRIDCS